MKRIVPWAIAVALGVSVAVEADDSIPADWKLKTPEEAAAATLAFFPSSERDAAEIAASAELTVIEDCQIPFVSASVNGQQCWSTEIEVTLDLLDKLPPDSSDDRVRKFEVRLIAETGQLVHIACVRADDYEFKATRPKPDSAEKILTSVKELIVDLASERPKVSFMEALDNVVGNPLGATELHAWHVMYSRFDYSAGEYEAAHAVWWIDLRGVKSPFEPMAGRGKYVPIKQRNHMRSVIDSKTGVHIRSSTTPG